MNTKILKSLGILISWLEESNFHQESAHLYKFAGIKEDLLKQHPDFEAELTLAEQANIKPGFLPWVAKQLTRQEPIDEIISMIGEYQKFHKNLEKKDLYQYESLGDLRFALENMDSKTQQRKKKRQELEGDYDKLYESENFLVIHPHTRDASCHFGQGTRWCVSATMSQNYFNQYASKNVFLYFILNKNTTQDDPFQKMAYAYTKTDKGQEAEIFNAEDRRIYESIVKEHLGAEFVQINAAILSHLAKQENTKFNEMVAEMTVSELDHYLNAIQDPNEEDQFINMLLIHKQIPDDVLTAIATRYLDDFPRTGHIIDRLEANPVSKREVKEKILRTIRRFYHEHFESDYLQELDVLLSECLIAPPDLLHEILSDALNKKPTGLNSGYHLSTIIGRLAGNFNTSTEDLERIYRSGKSKGQLARNPKLPPQFLDGLARNPFDAKGEKWPGLQENVAHNPNTSVDTLKYLASISIYSFLTDEQKQKIEEEVMTYQGYSPKDAFEDFYGSYKRDVRTGLAVNENTPPEILIALSDRNNADNRTRVLVAKNPKTPTEALKKILTEPLPELYSEIFESAMESPNLTPELLDYVYAKYEEAFGKGKEHDDDSTSLQHRFKIEKERLNSQKLNQPFNYPAQRYP